MQPAAASSARPAKIKPACFLIIWGKHKAPAALAAGALLYGFHSSRFAQQVAGCKDGVGQFGFLGTYLANVMEQTGAAGVLHIETKLSGHSGAEIGYFAAMLQQILAVRRAEPHAADHPNQLGMQAV
nr:hypothetical protein [Tanacetum cinerariifolium]